MVIDSLVPPLVRLRSRIGAIALSLVVMLSVAIALPSPSWALGGPQPPLQKPAPAFTLPTNTGDGEISLSDYLGQWVVVYFYPQDFTSGCTLEARLFQKDLLEYQKRNTAILGISADDVASHAEFCDAEGLTFPLLADINGAVSKAYGSWIGYTSIRHTYVVDPDGVMKARFLGVRPSGHSQEVLETLDHLQG